MSQPHLLHRLQQADRAWQQQTALGWVLRGWKWAVLALAVVLVADIVLHLEARQRLMLDGLLLLGLGGTVGWAIHTAWFKTNPMERIARVLEERSPVLGSKLINVLQLHQKFVETPNPSPLTRMLAEQAVNDAAREVNHIPLLPLTKDANMGRIARWHALLPTALALIVAVVCFRAFDITVTRFLDPFGDHPPYSLTRIMIEEPMRSDSSVMYRGSFSVKVKWSGHDPKELFLTAQPPNEPEKAVTLPMIPQEPGVFVLQLDDIRTDLLVYAHTRNRWSTSTAHPLAVLLTPQFASATVAVKTPNYTGLPEKKSPFTFSGLTALSGSQITVTLRSNRPLKSGQITLAAGSGAPQEIELKPSEEKLDEVTGSFIAEASGRMSFSLLDVGDVPSDEARTSAFTVTHDLAPQVGIPQPPRDGVVVEGFPLDARITASDDYGLKLLRVHVARNGEFGKPLETSFLKVTRSESVALPLMTGENPPKAGDVITFFAEAMDTFPKTHISRSEMRTLTVITNEQYQDMLRQQHTVAELESKYAAILGEQRELVERQKALAEEAAKVAKEAAEKPGDPALAKRAENLQKEQDKINEGLMKSAEKMEKFVSETPLYDIESEFAEALQEQAKAIKESVEQNKSAPRSSQKDMAQAAKEHQERLDGPEQEGSEKIADALADLAKLQELVNDFNHFAALYEQQDKLTQQAQPYNKPQGSLDETDQLAVQNLGALQRSVGEDLRDLAEKIRKDIEAAKDTFPKACASGEKLAHAIENVRMEHLAGLASGKMLRGDGRGGHQGAERLLQEMRSLFGECQGAGGEMGQELDTCLSLKHGMAGGNTMKQMMQSRRFGFNRGTGMGGQGSGMGGFMMGNTVGGGQGVYGAEDKLGRSGGVGNGKGEGQPGGGGIAEITKTEQSTGPAQVNRASDSVPATTLMEQYRSLTDAYFNRITRDQAPPEAKPDDAKKP